MEVFDIISSVPFRLKIGDPNPLAWGTVAIYLIAAIGCLLCAADAKRIFGAEQVGVHRLVWAGMFVIMLFLGINKQLDLQTFFTSVIKALARHYDMYELGKRSQGVFLGLLGGTAIGGMGVVAWMIRRQWRRYVFLILGALFIVRFVLVRAGGFYGVSLPRVSVLTGGVKLNWLLEILGAAVVAVAAFLNWRSARKAQGTCTEKCGG